MVCRLIGTYTYIPYPVPSMYLTVLIFDNISYDGDQPILLAYDIPSVLTCELCRTFVC